jgi:hypothetical protein
LQSGCNADASPDIRDEHDYTAQMALKDVMIDGQDMVGDARVSYDREHPQHTTYTCHFDSQGRVKDSSYHLY